MEAAVTPLGRSAQVFMSLTPLPQGGSMRISVVTVLSMVCLLLTSVAAAEDTVSVPWPEFRQLFQESIEKKLKADLPSPSKPQIAAIESGVYHMELKQGRVEGKFAISGRVLSGGPEAITLFAHSVVIDQILAVSGGHLLFNQGGPAGIAFYPDGVGPFHVEATFLTPLTEDHRYATVSLAIPPALKNALYLNQADRSHLAAQPGIQAQDGAFCFAGRNEMTLRFTRSDLAEGGPPPQADLLTGLRWEALTTRMETFIWPRQPLPVTYELIVPDGFALVSASLAMTTLTQVSAKRVRIEVPPEARLPFSLVLSRTEPDPEAILPVVLPSIEGNSGSQGNFIMDQPDNRHVSIALPTAATRRPLADLPAGLQTALGPVGFYLQTDPGTVLPLEVKRLRQAEVPPVVLNDIGYFTVYEENGNQLATLIMDVPAEVGGRLMLQPMADARVWRLQVNKVERHVLVHDDGSWMIPLDRGRSSRVELAMLITGAKLSLQGKLSARIPQTGLPARRLWVGIALPERVQLLSVEGAVNPAAGKPALLPETFGGQPHFFAHAFYKGQGMDLAIAYKEPVLPAQQ
jgi:hypothetical protein